MGLRVMCGTTTASMGATNVDDMTGEYTAKLDFVALTLQLLLGQLIQPLITFSTHRNLRTNPKMENISPGSVAENAPIPSSPILTPSTTFRSIGLWIAYHHANAQSQPVLSLNETIIVIDAEYSPFGATSGTCTGCIHYGFKDKGLVNLGKYSFALWEYLTDADKFRSTLGLHFSSIFSSYLLINCVGGNPISIGG
ncbi:hypothetical protein K458DRAFT_402028 [Lentithecium fluviatile CBS 122367]|uniref:Uncharacterized protein n=1 Tax=Lentithecium fluviatile CBS 122367 TaxID=1168545 RepID=A0A6G1JAH4_9PLEO|nr:hypothetical protein K458DRAFT_402028 [Lentithecium fluviatile CBS 122367]